MRGVSLWETSTTNVETRSKRGNALDKVEIVVCDVGGREVGRVDVFWWSRG